MTPYKMQLKLSITGLLLWIFAFSLIYFSCTRLLAKNDKHNDDPSIDCSVPESSTAFAAIMITSLSLIIMFRKHTKK
jgi:hypothetical protein